MHIVIVDSSRVVMKILSSMLEQHGHDTHQFTDGHEALAYIRTNQSIDLLITGLEMPTISGFELCWEVRLLAQKGRQIYIIALSAHEDERKLSQSLDSGADDFISKPPKLQELLARIRVAERMMAMQTQLIKLASIDPLTEILNRRAFFDTAEVYCLKAMEGQALAAIMFDVDHFKQVNDRFGHDVGDQALLAVAQSAQHDYGVFARMGGEEFALLLPEISGREALEIAECLRADVERLVIETGTTRLSLTCSYGVSDWRKEDSLEKLLKRADMALYRAKENGRNQVQFEQSNFVDEFNMLEEVDMDNETVLLNS